MVMAGRAREGAGEGEGGKSIHSATPAPITKQAPPTRATTKRGIPCIVTQGAAKNGKELVKS